MKKALTSILLIIGVLLILCSAVFAVMLHIEQNKAIKHCQCITEEILSLIPEKHPGFKGDSTDGLMPTVEIEYDDYIGIIEVPLYDTALPVYAEWDNGNLIYSPCRFSGSAYGEKLIIGGLDSIGQFDFTKVISIGDTVTFTDVTGAVFTYTVSNVEICDNADAETLSSSSSDLTLFAKNSTSYDYTLIHCNSDK
ncbi:MAG: sortase [Clostridia bacterium]|nr:sortase [Clostridia bacterium]